MARSANDAPQGEGQLAVDPLVALREMLAGLRVGDRRALGHAFEQFGEMVFRTSLRLTDSRADAEDVTQDVFVRLPGSVGSFAGAPAQFASWLRRVAVRASLMRLRTGRRRERLSVGAVASLVTPAERTEARLSLEAALRRLSDEQRTVFLLKEVEGYDHAEIAALVGISVANSEVRLHRARRRLRELLRDSR